MRIFEFAGDDPLRVKLTAVAEMLKNKYLDNDSKEPLSTDAFLNILKNYDIQVEKSDLFNMVKKEPLVNIIQNINGEQVIFKGQLSSQELPAPKPGENEKTREKMAKSALEI